MSASPNLDGAGVNAPAPLIRATQPLRADAALRGTSEQEALRQSLSRIPLGRMAEPEEIANAVVFLASAKASYVTGVTITMDGAQTPVVV